MTTTSLGEPFNKPSAPLSHSTPALIGAISARHFTTAFAILERHQTSELSLLMVLPLSIFLLPVTVILGLSE